MEVKECHKKIPDSRVGSQLSTYHHKRLACLLILEFWFQDHATHVSEYLTAGQVFDSGTGELLRQPG